ncbi:FliM/FliN family flagellar motor switch protein [Frigoriglobus tundricola]|uniref:Flagellar motor switch protein FliN n=1 Tax=Frigoriglobus tundricola TaxID=2774151 RepID=A0A6M5YK79_9BACT|nr:FliM/FliN family flagellar motor switch protein [Frigoriglobus tundricola]QJW94388.1 Flagellar motor switch protein FliN [Frigoriglobus tundricola]
MPDTAPTEAPTADLPPVEARRPAFPALDPRGSPSGGTPLDSLRDVPITITARLGHATLPIAAILRLGPGAVVELEEDISAPVELTVRGVPFATGEVIVIDDHFAIRIKNLLPPRTGKADV